LVQIDGEFPASFTLKGKEVAVKRKRLSVEQIVAALNQAELGTPVADLIRHRGIAAQTFYCWK
jgi:putative transposase